MGDDEGERHRAQAAQYLRVPPADLEPDDPALLNWRTAFRCAQELGGRLPTGVELQVALDGCEIEPGCGFECEWTSGFVSGEPSTRFRLPYGFDDDGERKPELHYEIRWPYDRPTCFRLVVPAEPDSAR